MKWKLWLIVLFKMSGECGNRVLNLVWVFGAPKELYCLFCSGVGVPKELYCLFCLGVGVPKEFGS